MDAALLGDGPPPLPLRHYLVAAGVGDVHGLGAEAVYGPGQLDLETFELVYAIQQRVMLIQSEEGQGDMRRETSIRRTLRLEREGMLDRIGFNPLETGDLPFDPGG